MLFYIQIPQKPPKPVADLSVVEPRGDLAQDQLQRHHRVEVSQLRQGIRETYALERRFML